MRKLTACVCVLAFLSHCAFASLDSFGGIKLLEGYSITPASAIDATAWIIEKRGGLKIDFEAGPNEASWADPEEKTKYSWYQEQKVNGFDVRFALIKPGLRTVWEPSDSRALPVGNILLVTFLLDGPKSHHTANFSAKLAEPSDLGDALLMVMTFDPSKGRF